MAQPHRRRTIRRYAIRLPFLNISVPIPANLTLRNVVHVMIDHALYILGPLLIIVALGILCVLVHTFYFIILPLRTQGDYTSPEAIFHQAFVTLIVANILFNYHACVRTPNAGTEAYECVVRALANATGFCYPETSEEKKNWGLHWKDLMLTRSRISRERALARQVADEANLAIQAATSQYKEQNADTSLDITVESGGSSNNVENSTKHRRKRNTTTVHHSTTSSRQRPWMMIGPHEWSYCSRTTLPKPPRSHYDHVTRTLVLNMDHYCPWMFNVVGYFNYRYFVNFLIFVSVGMMYGTIITWPAFMAFDTPKYYDQIAESRNLFNNSTMATKQTGNQSVAESVLLTAKFHMYEVKHLYPYTPTPVERTPIGFCFMICLAIGIAVSGLLVFHLYLICTAQTTIELHANGIFKAQAKDCNQTWTNPHDLGWRRNIEQVWGSPSVRWRELGLFGWGLGMLLRIGPSWRNPEFLPVPLKEDTGNWSSNLKTTYQRSGTKPTSEDMIVDDIV